MTQGYVARIIGILLLALMASTSAIAVEVYHWVDENGVQNFSQYAPAGTTSGVDRLTLADTSPPDYDPEEDRYHVQAQAERMKALREEMEKRREESRDRRRKAPQQQIVQVQEPVRYSAPWLWNRPIQPRPPVQPQPPVPEPYPTVPFRPLDQ